MLAKRLFKEYQERVLQNPEQFRESLKEVTARVAQSPAKYKGEPVEFLYQPMFFAQEDMERFEALTGKLMKILNKVIDQYLENEQFRSYFGFSPLLERLILKDPGYQMKVPMGRFDIFYHYNDQFQFCELNADGSSGMVEQRELEQILADSSALKGFDGQYHYEGFEIFDSWVRALLTNYKEYSQSEDKPQVAIVDFMKANPPSEFLEFQKSFEKAGCKTVIADPRELTYVNGKLYFKDFKIDCVYRRAVTWEIIENADSVRPLIDAYLAGDVCVVGPLRSQVIHNKQIFAILHDPEKTPFLNQEERDFIKQHIPYTRIFDNQNSQLVQEAIENKDRLVLKPMDKYASNGVRVGSDYSLEEWKRIISEEARESYLLQEFCQVPKLPMARIDEKNVEFIPHNYIIGLFMYNEKLQGIYTRTGTQNIIGSIVECFTVPNYLFKEKASI